MSVLVRGITMPESCLYCCMCVDTHNGTSICNFTGNGVEQPEIRNKNCPLVELPAKHGRLFDEAEVKKVIEEVHDDVDKWGAVALLEWAIEKRCCVEAEDE